MYGWDGGPLFPMTLLREGNKVNGEVVAWGWGLRFGDRKEGMDVPSATGDCFSIIQPAGGRV